MTHVKTLIVILGLSTTFGLWALFSRDLEGSLQPAGAVESQNSNPPQVDNWQPSADQVFLSSLPPIPTLVSGSLEPVAGLQPVSPVPVLSPAVMPGKIYLGGAAPSASSTNTVVTTTTRSSR